MNRRNFFKNLGAATVGVIVAPAIIIKALKNDPKILCGKGLFKWIEEEFKKRETFVYTGEFNLEDFEEFKNLLSRPPEWATKYQWVYPHPDNLKSHPYNKAL